MDFDIQHAWFWVSDRLLNKSDINVPWVICSTNIENSSSYGGDFVYMYRKPKYWMLYSILSMQVYF